MKVLVLGGNGFIGSHVVDNLLSAGHFVRVFDRSDNRMTNNQGNVEYFIGNLDDTLLLAEALTDIDVVFHGISTTVPSTSNIDPINDVETNLIATLRLLQLMREMSIPRIVFLSSGGTVYGDVDADFISEGHTLNPVCSYGVVKVCIENYLTMFTKLHGLRPIVLRPSNPYGERQGHVGVQGVIGTFLSKIQKHEPLEVWGDGSVVRDFIYVGDLSQICLKAIESDVVGTFNVGGGCGYSIKEVIETIVDVTGVDANVVFMPARAFDLNRVVLDISFASKIFNWRPQTSLPQGIKKTWHEITYERA